MGQQFVHFQGLLEFGIAVGYVFRPGAQFVACSSPRSRLEPAVRTPGRPVARHPQPQGSEANPAARNTLDSVRIPRASKLLISGLFEKGRVLAQDGVYAAVYERALERGDEALMSKVVQGYPPRRRH